MALESGESNPQVPSAYGAPGAQSTELWIPVDRVGMVIGSGGSVIRSLQERSGATLMVHNDTVSPSGGEKLLTVVGGPDNVTAALSMVSEILQRPARTQGNDPFGASNGAGSTPGAPGDFKTIYVPNSCVGVIIGKGGETIRDMQSRTGAHIKVTPDREAAGAAERSITLSGPPHAIELANTLVMDLVREGLSRFGGQNTGAPTTDAFSRYSSVVETLMVPNDKVGLVIGKGGATIRELQQRSGARIQVAKEGEAGAAGAGGSLYGAPGQPLPPQGGAGVTRAVTLTGPRPFVDAAKALISEKVAGYSAAGPVGGTQPTAYAYSAGVGANTASYDPYGYGPAMTNGADVARGAAPAPGGPDVSSYEAQNEQARVLAYYQQYYANHPYAAYAAAAAVHQQQQQQPPPPAPQAAQQQQATPPPPAQQQQQQQPLPAEEGDGKMRMG